MEQIKLPTNFSNNVMAAIEQEVARREKRDELFMYVCIFTVGMLGLVTLGYFGYRYEWFIQVRSWIEIDTTLSISLSPIWISIIISSLLLVSASCYLSFRRETASI